MGAKATTSSRDLSEVASAIAQLGADSKLEEDGVTNGSTLTNLQQYCPGWISPRPFDMFNPEPNVLWFARSIPMNNQYETDELFAE